MRTTLPIVATILCLYGYGFAGEEGLLALEYKNITPSEKTTEGWFISIEEVKALKSKSVEPDEVIQIAKNHLSEMVKVIQTGTIYHSIPIPVAVHDWDFSAIVVKEFDFAKVRGALISWEPQRTGRFYYEVQFFPLDKNNSEVGYDHYSVFIMPDLTILRSRNLPATERETKQHLLLSKRVKALLKMGETFNPEWVPTYPSRPQQKRRPVKHSLFNTEDEAADSE